MDRAQLQQVAELRLADANALLEAHRWEKHARSDSNFEIHWNTVRDWSVTSRYEPGITEALARGMYEAVTNSASGVLPWLRTQW
jgi:hypothetical protein